MSEEVFAIPTMHEDHRNWQSEHSMWKQDLASWNKQIDLGLSKLDELAQLMRHQQQVLAEHDDTIDKQEESLQSHEHKLVGCEKLGIEYQQSLTEKHFEMQKQIDRARVVHERIKKYHHELMARLVQLGKAMDKPM